MWHGNVYDSAVLRSNLEGLVERIARAAESCGRKPEDVRLLPVTKARPGAVEVLHELGLREFAESRVQEILPKLKLSLPGVRWHFIGHLQENKINKILPHIDLLHSLDSLKLARALDKRALQHECRLPVLLQVKTCSDKNKGGVALDEAVETYAQLVELPNLELRGLMTIASNSQRDKDIRQSFKALHEVYERLQRTSQSPKVLSMGMSQDFEIAIQEGATLVRVGTALLGKRSKK